MDDKELINEWNANLDKLQALDEDSRKHFARLVLVLAACYRKDDPHKAAVVVATGDSMLTFCVGANSAEMSEMLAHAGELVTAVMMDGAPSKEMFN